jgi:hypothetical protein
MVSRTPTIMSTPRGLDEAQPLGRAGSTPAASRAQVAAMVAAYKAKPGNEGGGNLHILTDDGNIWTGHVLWCRGYAAAHGDPDGVAICDATLTLTHRQRAKVFR